MGSHHGPAAKTREGALVGVLSVDEILAKAGDAGDGLLSYRDAVVAFQSTCRRGEPVETATR